MDRVSVSGSSARAIVGSGQYLCWTPCHHRPVRLTEPEVRPCNTARCSQDSRLWEVSFFKKGLDWLALWVVRHSDLPGDEREDIAREGR
ncbi:MAG: hypothetical protein ACRDZ4_15335 [Egibacteraceae bacterium]